MQGGLAVCLCKKEHFLREDGWPNLNVIAAAEGRSTIYYRFLNDTDMMEYDNYQYALSTLNQNQRAAYVQALGAVTAIYAQHSCVAADCV